MSDKNTAITSLLCSVMSQWNGAEWRGIHVQFLASARLQNYSLFL